MEPNAVNVVNALISFGSVPTNPFKTIDHTVKDKNRSEGKGYGFSSRNDSSSSNNDSKNNEWTHQILMIEFPQSSRYPPDN